MKQLNLWSERLIQLEFLVDELERLVAQVAEAEKKYEEANAAMTAWSAEFRRSTGK